MHHLQATEQENKEDGNFLSLRHLQFQYCRYWDEENTRIANHVDDSHTQVELRFIDGAISGFDIIPLRPVIVKGFAVEW